MASVQSPSSVSTMKEKLEAIPEVLHQTLGERTVGSRVDPREPQGPDRPPPPVSQEPHWILGHPLMQVRSLSTPSIPHARYFQSQQKGTVNVVYIHLGDNFYEILVFFWVHGQQQAFTSHNHSVLIPLRTNFWDNEILIFLVIYHIKVCFFKSRLTLYSNSIAVLNMTVLVLIHTLGLCTSY